MSIPIPLPLPPAPEGVTGPVRAWHEPVLLPCAGPEHMERHPVFSISPEPVFSLPPGPLEPRPCQALHLENDWLRFLIVPDAGAAIYVAMDNARAVPFLPPPAQLLYHFNAWHIEQHADGACTVWCSQADSRTRVRLSRGFTLYPGRAYLELKVRVFNQSPLPQHFVMPELIPGFSAAAVHLCADRQPDGTWYPYETKTWSEFLYAAPLPGITMASVDAAAHLSLHEQFAELSVLTTSAFPGATLSLIWHGMAVWDANADLSPGSVYQQRIQLPAPLDPSTVMLRLKTSRGRELLLQPTSSVSSPASPASQAGTSLAPRKVATLDQLHTLAQQETDPAIAESLWNEALRREGSDLRAHTALGLLNLKRGALEDAETLLSAASQRSGEAQYLLGVCLRYLGRDQEARAALKQATRHYPWRAAALYALGELEVANDAWELAPKHLYEGLRLNADNNHLRSLAAVVFRRFGRNSQADGLLAENLTLDPLDPWACHLAGKPVPGDNRTRLDIALQCIRAGLFAEAKQVLTGADIFADDGSAPMLHFTLGMISEQLGEALDGVNVPFQRSLPYQTDELLVLQRAVLRDPADADAFYHLGNWLAGHGRVEQARECWTIADQLRPTWAPALRNLGRYDEAFAADPSDAQLFWERDCAWKANRVPAPQRLLELERHPQLVAQREDLTREMAALYSLLNQPERTLAFLHNLDGSHEQLLRAELKLACRELDSGQPEKALSHLLQLLTLDAERPETHFWLGETYRALDRRSEAFTHWQRAVALDHSELNDQTYYRALSLSRLGETREVRTLLRQLWFHGRRVAREKPPSRKAEGLFLQSQARVAMGQWKLARRVLDQLLTLDPNHERALDLRAGLPPLS